MTSGTVDVPSPSHLPDVISSIGRRLRVVLSRPSAVLEPAMELTVSAPTQVEFVAYAEDVVLSGYVGLEADRLSDLLNDHEEYLLVDVLASDLLTGHDREVTEILVARDELLLVHASGPRGDAARRIRTRQFPIALSIGPFEVRGYLHCRPGTNPLRSFSRRRQMVPLTEAWIDYDIGGAHQRRRVSTLIVNRRLVDWIVEAVDDEVEMPDVQLTALPDSRAKDMTGYLWIGPS